MMRSIRNRYKYVPKYRPRKFRPVRTIGMLGAPPSMLKYKTLEKGSVSVDFWSGRGQYENNAKLFDLFQSWEGVGLALKKIDAQYNFVMLNRVDVYIKNVSVNCYSYIHEIEDVQSNVSVRDRREVVPKIDSKIKRVTVPSGGVVTCVEENSKDMQIRFKVSRTFGPDKVIELGTSNTALFNSKRCRNGMVKHLTKYTFYPKCTLPISIGEILGGYIKNWYSAMKPKDENRIPYMWYGPNLERTFVPKDSKQIENDVQIEFDYFVYWHFTFSGSEFGNHM